MAFSLSQAVVLGLTQPSMNERKVWNNLILPYEERKREIEAYVQSLNRLSDLKIIPIDDIYGSTREDEELQAIVVTPHTKGGADQINLAREKRGLTKLTVHVCELVTDDAGDIISSTRIREGKINRSGF